MVTREDLSSAQQAVQGMHAALMYAAQYDANVAYGSLVFLSVPGLRELLLLLEKMRYLGDKLAYFCEPDLDGALTAIAAGPEAARRLSRLPLALRGGETDV